MRRVAVVAVSIQGHDALEFRFDALHDVAAAREPGVWLALAALAKLILFVRPGGGVALRAGALAAVALLTAAQLGAIAPHVQLAIAAGAFVVLTVMRARAQEAGGPTSGAQQIALIAALLLVHHALVRTPAVVFYWQDCLLGAIALSARLARTLPQTRAREAAYALLLVFALFATIWIAFAWTVHRLEWGFSTIGSARRSSSTTCCSSCRRLWRVI